jgi:hypothetical protein
MFDRSSYSKYEFKYSKFYIIFQFSLVIKQIITKYMIFSKNILNKTND